MSFVIAATYMDSEAWIAADTQATDMKTRRTEAQTKINVLSDSAAMAFSGNFAIAQAIVNAYEKSFSNTWTVEKSIQELRKTALIYSLAYTVR